MIIGLVLASVVASAATGPGTFGVGISPSIVTGPASSTAAFTVRDAGTVPLHLRMQAVEERPVTGGGWVPWEEFDQATVSPEALNLNPGQASQVKVVVNATDGYAHRLAITALAKPQAVSTGASVTPQVAAAYRIPGRANPYAGAVTIPHPAKPGPGFPWGIAGLGVLGAAALTGLITAGKKLRITRR